MEKEAGRFGSRSERDFEHSDGSGKNKGMVIEVVIMPRMEKSALVIYAVM